MRKMGRYCKAYPIERFREYGGWPAEAEHAIESEAGGKSFLYLQEDYSVTGDIFMEENVIFKNISPEWIQFCKERLNFEVPVYEKAAETGQGQ